MNITFKHTGATVSQFFICLLLVSFLSAQCMPTVRAFDDVYSEHEIEFLHPGACDPTGEYSSASGTSPTENANIPPACSVCSADGGAIDGSNLPAGTAEGKANEKPIFDFFVGEGGLKPFQAAGIMGNMWEESGLIPSRVQGAGIQTADEIKVDGVTGFGLVQWTSSGRQQGLVDLANKTVPKPKTSNLTLQLKYVMKELNTTHTAAFAKLKASTNSDQATEAIEIYYEAHAGVPSGNLHQIRKDKAREFLTKYGSGSPSSDLGTPPSSGGACGENVGPEGESTGPAGAFDGTAQEAAKALLDNSGIDILDDRALVQKMADGQDTPLDGKLIIMLASLAKTHTFSISSMYRGPCSGSNHCVGKAADINPTIDGQTISYSGNNPKIQKFIDDAAKIMGGNCENGVPNEKYVSTTRANGSKCQVFLDIGSGPHVHLAVSA